MDKKSFLLEKNEIVANQDFSTEERFIKKNHFVPLHYHDYFELEIITEGKIEHKLNDTHEIIGVGDAYLLSPMAMHSVKILEDVKMINICFSENALSDTLNLFINAAGGITCAFKSKEIAIIKEQIKKIQENRDFIFYHEMLSSTISQIVLDVLRKSDIKAQNLSHTPVQAAIFYIMRNFRKDISINSAAEEICLTPKYLGAVFKKNTNSSFHEYLNRVRLKYACNMLKSSDISIKEIAYESGYNSVEHFLYVFKKHLKMTPKNYRLTQNNQKLML